MEFQKLAIATAGLAPGLRESISMASDAGADGVQLDVRGELAADEFGESACRQLLCSLAERNLKLSSTTFPLRRPLYDAEHIDGRVAALREGLRLTARLKCRVMTLRIGRLPEESQKAETSRLRDSLNDLTRWGGREGVTLAIATGGDSPDAMRAMLAEVQEGPIGVDFDPAGCITCQLSPVRIVQALHDLIVHVQARDAVRDVETGGYEVALGRGETPWDEILSILGDSGYPGWLTVRRTTGADRSGDVSRAIAYLRAVASGR